MVYMEITVVTDYKKAVFTWDDDLENCDFVSMGFSDEEIEEMIQNKVHEGADFKNYEVTIK